MRNQIRTIAARAALLQTITCLTAMGQVTFRPLGVSNILLTDMSADGSVAVGMPISFTGEASGIRWTPGGGVERIGGDMSNIAISRDGKTIVGAALDGRTGPRTAAIWQGGTNWRLLGGLPGGIPNSGTGILSYTQDVSADGSVIVGRSYDSSKRLRAVRWSASTGIVDLGSLDGGDTVASVVSANGKLIGGYDYKQDTNGVGSGRRGAVWVDGFERLMHLYGWAGEVRATNDVGSVIVGDAHPFSGAYLDIGGGLMAYRYTAWDGLLLNLGGIWKRGPGLPGEDFSSAPSTVSDDGNVVCGQAFLAGPRQAFIWMPQTGMLLLSDYLTRNGITAHNDWRLIESVNYLSPDGKTILGSGLNSQGLVETFIITRP